MTESSAISGANGASAVSAGASFFESRALAVGAAVQAMAELAGAVLPDPADSLDRGVALSQVWAEQGQQGGAVVGGDMRVLAAQTGQAVAARLSAVSPIETGRIDRALTDFVRAVQDHARATPHLTAPAVVEPMLRALTAGLAREEGPAAARDSAVEQFARMVDAATASLDRR
ncbi:hypothetical protein [Brevundimonas diminuta]|uniref:hypothetical protein n=1 Tax=Brevundimonas diminuta TaxID=293 RepID=UPI0006280D45|nr:hypothetical protein [Brevundimonas diminuta]